MTLSSVLIVDDEPAVRDLMSRWVIALGLRPHTAASADEALETMRRQRYDLAVIDVMMPGHDGLWLAGELRREHPHTALVLATAYTDLVAGETPQPIADFLIKPFQRERFALAVDRGLQWRKQTLEELHWHAMLSIELRDRATAISAAVWERALNGESEEAVLRDLALEQMAETAAHGDRVARYAQAVAREMGIADLGPSLAIAARFHDVGKLAIPEALVTKPSPLSDGEKAIMRQHVDVGADILEATDTLRIAAPIVRASHEWFGGGGYPQQLAGDAIPMASRIIAVVDAYDAMTQDRAYRIRFDSADAVAELLRCAPAQFDPRVVGAFLDVLGRH